MLDIMLGFLIGVFATGMFLVVYAVREEKKELKRMSNSYRTD